MNPSLFYLTLPHDSSGSMSKNRFRLELLWGISKMLDIMETDQDFVMVFDYVCDIEVHYEDGFEFFQIKTHGRNKAYTTKSLTKIEGEGSILGKLYILNKEAENQNIHLALVSNIPYNAMPINILKNCFTDLSVAERNKIVEALRKELNIEKIDLSNIFYIQTGMNLENPENEIRGKLVLSFEKLKGCEPTNPNALYRLVVDTVQEKACYEYSARDYAEIVRLKGLSRSEFDYLLDLHSDNARTGIQPAGEYIESIRNISHRRIYKKALPSVVKMMSTSKPLKAVEQKIATALLQSDDIGNMESAINYLTALFHSEFPVEMNNAEKIVFYIIIIKRFEEGVYDCEDDI